LTKTSNAGIHGWVIYSLIGLLLSLMTFREGLPMTVKSCFYPILGDRIFGWIGDLVDLLSIVTTLFGVRVARFFLVQTYQNGKKYIPNDLKLYQKAVNYTKWP
jgi:choline/glycine/proline betaine transport protein